MWEAQDKNSAAFIPNFGLLSYAPRGNFYLKLPALHMVFPSVNSYRDYNIVRFMQK